MNAQHLTKLLGVSIAAWLAHGASSADLFYDIAHWNHFSGPLSPSYGPQAHVAVDACPLQSTGGLRYSRHSDQGGQGKFWFGGWSTSFSPGPNGPRIEFCLTPKGPLTPVELKYSWFVGIWSDLWSGPPLLEVFVSKDGFVTSQLVASHWSNYRLPWAVSPTFVDDLTTIGTLEEGQTLTVRFVASGEAPSNSDTPTGFSNQYPGLESNLIFSFAGSGTCPGDLSGDGLVSDSDFSAFAIAYDLLDCADPSMPAGCPADLNGDGLVDDADFSSFAVAYDRLLCP